MNKKIISAAMLMAMSSAPVMADKEIKGSMFDGHKRVLQAQCIRMDDPDGVFDGKFLGAVFEQAGSSDMFRFKSAYLLNKKEMEACKVAADVMPAFKIEEDDEDYGDHEHEYDDEDGHEEYGHDDEYKENGNDKRNDNAVRG